MPWAASLSVASAEPGHHSGPGVNPIAEHRAVPGSIHVVAAALIDAQGRVLLAQRPSGKHLAGYWEFPGGKVEPGESALHALRREILEEIGVEIGAADPLIRIPWHYPGKTIVLDVYCVRDFHGEPRSCEGQPLKWVPAAALDPAEMPAADHPVINALRLPRTYLITPEPGSDHNAFLARLEQALERGVRLIQLRAKDLADRELRDLASACQTRVRAAGGRLLINSRVDLVEELGLDGVHLNAAQLRDLDARPLSHSRWIGASCHDAAEIVQAQTIGVDFVVLGPVAATASHPDTRPLGWDRFQSLCDSCALPVYALGGMRDGDTSVARSHGGQGIAAISGLW